MRGRPIKRTLRHLAPRDMANPWHANWHALAGQTDRPGVAAAAREIARSRTVRTLGRRRWKKEAGYPLQARVENAFFRYKSIIGDRLRALAASGSPITRRKVGGKAAPSSPRCG